MKIPLVFETNIIWLPKGSLKMQKQYLVGTNSDVSYA